MQQNKVQITGKKTVFYRLNVIIFRLQVRHDAHFIVFITPSCYSVNVSLISQKIFKKCSTFSVNHWIPEFDCNMREVK